VSSSTVGSDKDLSKVFTLGGGSVTERVSVYFSQQVLIIFILVFLFDEEECLNSHRENAQV